MVPVTVVTATAGDGSAAGERAAADDGAGGLPPATGRIEIALAGGCRVIVDRAARLGVIGGAMCDSIRAMTGAQPLDGKALKAALVAAEDELAAERAAAGTTTIKAFERRKPSRKPFPAHLSRERVVIPAPTVCNCCGSDRLSKIGEDVTETLEVIPRQWKVIQMVREKYACRDCEKISQPPALFHVTPRGWAGPGLLAMIMFEKYGQHQPLNRQSARCAESLSAENHGCSPAPSAAARGRR